ncbi:chemotaxis protein MotB [Caulobacter vibrioides]|uniref:Chemotaxis MotB protein n=2 Tax=Caulobacter vibrioides TaxID=155892 RepID=Q9A7Z4_CAUVC|nr:flagellar motor protein MotB [Caulobacter vibrioides]YP_002517017.1 chemotaxis protein MotB [Caulobacter vibrioides NA1000]AAK23552.1 chemotaxis MotB protein [Caulobacter vibrioides CB15]ACL95109.1 chemotaxis protein MotB [Caulobacter vibrioides NA1000]ATC24585.1 chemotaxis protein MotB [Caulobacter vibrioides]ATC28377.1 chemotaxis protein MotB [Caulobacter vibrioides]AZH12725.1 chemotaxis protein MotB [Caulobacter vibrioides]
MAVNSEQPIIIKKVKKGGGHGHHGGAWKVAYADFVTAMMAFFLLMWLLNTTSPEQKQGIADYFAPASISSTTSGSGGILGGTSLGDDGAKADGKLSVVQQMAPEAQDVTKEAQSSETANLDSASEQALRDALAKKEQDSFASAAQSLRQSLQDMPELAELSKQILIDQTPEGLRIQLVDQEGRSMFKENSREPNDRARVLLRAVAKVINQLPNRVTISGHTSANAFGKKQDGDWALSAQRADASRQVLRSAGVDDDRVYQVSGKANSEPLYADDPTLAGNRRISIVLLREKPVLPDGL